MQFNESMISNISLYSPSRVALFNKRLSYRRQTARHFVSVEMLSTVVRLMKTDRALAWGALSATATYHPATCFAIVEPIVTTRVRNYMHRYNKLNYRKASIRCSASHNVTLKWAVRVIANFHDSQHCWWHHVLDQEPRHFYSHERGQKVWICILTQNFV